MKAFLILLLFLGAGVSSAAERLWLNLHSKYRYKDPLAACDNHALGLPVYLWAEIEDQRVTRAVLVTTLQLDWAPKLVLDAIEIERLEFYRDSRNRFWLKSWQLSPRIVSFLLSHTYLWVEPCSSFAIQTTDPDVHLDFDLEGVDAEVRVSLSENISFHGKLTNGSSYGGEILLNQRQLGS